MSYGVIIKC